MTDRLTGDRYVNPYTDFGFKMLFGTEMNKELLISFVNSLFDGKEVIKDLTYLNSEQLFTKLFEAAEIAKFSKQQYDEYEESLKAYRDWQNTIETAKMKSREEGRAEGIEVGRVEGIEVGRVEGIEVGRRLERIEMARKFKASGIPADIIAQNTGLSENEISEL